MRLAFISDIHGNATALDAVLEDIKSKKVDKVFVLGDVCYRGPEPKRALDIVRSLQTEVIKGNADEWVIRGVKKGEVPDQALEMMNKERDWIYSQLDKDSLEFLKNLPTDLNLEFENIKIHAFHATPESLFDVVLPFTSDEEICEKLMKQEADIYIYAHIHKPYIRYLNGKCIINIGSVGLPFDGLKNSSYAIVDIVEGCVQTTIVRVDYDVNKVIKQYKELNYPNEILLTKVLDKASL